MFCFRVTPFCIASYLLYLCKDGCGWHADKKPLAKEHFYAHTGPPGCLSINGNLKRKTLIKGLISVS